VLEVHWGAAGGCGRPPLHFFDYVEGGVQDERRELALGGGEVGERVTAGAGGAEIVGEEGSVGR